MNYDEAMKYITNTAKFGSNYGLSRTEKILELLDNPHKKLKCIHIAGTNGKGSTTSMISAVLKEAGYKVGMYTSPYLEEFEERMQIDGKNIPKDKLSEIITEISKVVDRVIELGYENPTEFEIITCAAYLYFYREKVDYAVIEVGLGGRLDSTNVIKPILSVITSISYDHINILGDTLEKITYEKAGIIKEGVPVIIYPQEKESEEIIQQVCMKKNSKLIKVSKNSAEFISVKLINETLDDKRFDGEIDINNAALRNIKYVQEIKVSTLRDKYEIELSLLGKHQILNCSLAIHVIEELMNLNVKISYEAIKRALRTVIWKGRLEVIKSEPLVVIDGAHNIDGICKLKESLEIYFKYKKLILILGILADKEVEKMVSTIVPFAYKVIAVTPHSDRGELSHRLKEVIIKYNPNCEAFEDYSEAYKRALNYCSNQDMLLISGSLYMIGDMRKIILRTRVQQ